MANPPTEFQRPPGSGIPLDAGEAAAVWGDANSTEGMLGTCATGPGVRGKSIGGSGVEGIGLGGGPGVFGEPGVEGWSNSQTAPGVFGYNYFSLGSTLTDYFRSAGVFGSSEYGSGVGGDSRYDAGVLGFAEAEGMPGVAGDGLQGPGVVGFSRYNVGMRGSSANSGPGVVGESQSVGGVYGTSLNGDGYGVAGESYNVPVYAHNTTADTPNKAYLGTRCCAGDFYGGVAIHDRLYVYGAKHFRIDHPLDPANKFLTHSAVESSEIKNIYGGVAILDEGGEALVELPEYFEALNKDFRYQLTPIGAPGRDLYIAEEIHNNHFRIGGGSSGMRVSWQVSGVRKDAWAEANRTPVEEEKPAEERGYYLHPALHGESEERSIERARYEGHIRLMEEHRSRMEENSRQAERLRGRREETRQRIDERLRQREEAQRQRREARGAEAESPEDGGPGSPPRPSAT